MKCTDRAGSGTCGPGGPVVRWTFNGEKLCAVEGQTIAAALLAAGCRAWRYTPRRGEPRGLFCGMGVCFDCLVQVDDRPNVRACQTPVADGMRVETQRGAGSWEAPP
jgi:predicted molibdopterin-dependent oxidoreductase YjgC